MSPHQQSINIVPEEILMQYAAYKITKELLSVDWHMNPKEILDLS